MVEAARRRREDGEPTGRSGKRWMTSCGGVKEKGRFADGMTHRFSIHRSPDKFARSVPASLIYLRRCGREMLSVALR